MNEVTTTDYGNFLNMISKVDRSHFLRDDEANETKQVWMIHTEPESFFTVFYFDRQEKFLGTSLEME